MNRVAGYIRVSSMNQVEGSSLDVQKTQIQAYCQLKGLELVNIYTEAAVSGGKPIDQRPEGSRLMESIRAREISGMIIVKLDRGFRNTIDCLQTVDELDKLNVSLHIIDLGGSSVDSQSPAGRFMLTVLAAAAEMERGQIKVRCNSGREKHRAEGKRIGEIPFGWTLDADGETLIEVVEEQKAIRLVHNLRSKGQTLKQIASRLDELGYRPKKGGTWTTNVIHKILRKTA